MPDKARKEYTENGATITCWEANVVPGYEIKKLRANGTEERNLSAAITPEAGKFYNITLNKDKGYTVSEDGKTYTVYTADGLMAWNDAAQNDLSLNCTLTADITLTGEWTPIGIDDKNQYTGTFDGNGKTITGLSVTGSNQYTGLFGCIGSGGTVQNVVLEGVQITSDNKMSNVGSVAGWSDGTVENCSVSGSVSGKAVVGGVVGYQMGGSITRCSSSATVKGMALVGGMAGATSLGATLTACYATGNVTIENNGSEIYLAGGVVGSNQSSTLHACYAWGSVTGSGSATIYVGGVVGNNYSGTLTGCYHATGNVSEGNCVGGVAGWNCKNEYVSSIITACYWGSNPDTGIGYNEGGSTTIETTKVTDGDWLDAVAQMNAALQSAGSEWQYELTGKLPTLTKQ